ncbi:hypothetical protein [Oceanobacillus sp. FSL H7-0719]|uniref:hypothetical protein n=1 Tax=Oceanobacillus sp. FSL H7-0719 TaxID=2954507 RepID=UPI003254B1DD
MSSYHQSVERTIQNVNDISAVSPPEMNSATRSKRDAEDVVIELESNLSSFTKGGKSKVSRTKEFLQRFEKTIDTAGTEKGEELVTGLTSSRAIYQAAKNKGLSVSTYTKNGKIMYRINATEDALKALGVKPDSHAKKAIKQSRKHRQAPIKYYDTKTGTHTWSTTGKKVINKHPSLTYLYNNTHMDSAKSVGAVAGRKVVQDLKDKVDIRGKGFTKALEPIGSALSYYSNYHDAQADGLSGKEAHSRAITDTAFDVVDGSAIQAGSIAVFTAAVPIPGVGTAIGVAAGLGVDWILNQGFGKSGKSVMDRAKGAFRKIKGWFS